MSSSQATAKAAAAEASRGSELRKDVVFDRWVIFSPARARRPSEMKPRAPTNPNPGPNYCAPSCPFCIGCEGECAPEIFRFPAGSPGWKVRVIENLYPALRRELEPQDPGEGREGRSTVRGFGFHDVVIETPLHGIQLADLSISEVRDVVLAYRERVQQLAKHDSIKYVQVFKNYGASAGASMSHSHSQIIGMPLIPSTVSARLHSTKKHFEETNECYLCAFESKDLLIIESANFSASVPYAASFPFEVWITPRKHAAYFHELDDNEAQDLGNILKLVLGSLSRQLNDPPFNLMIHSSPLPLLEDHRRHAHWFIQLLPQLQVVGGFELGTGCYINPVFPEDAAKLLRDLSDPKEA